MKKPAGSEKTLREELLALIRGGNAHMGFEDAISGFPMKDINRQVPNCSYTIWQLLEHIRICQSDILEFVRDPEYVSPDFPDGYWPQPDEIATPAMWKKTVKGFLADLAGVEDIVNSPDTDFFGPIPHARDYTVLREMLLVADHNAFHIGELVALRRALGMKPVKEY